MERLYTPLNGFLRFYLIVSALANLRGIIKNITKYINPFTEIETWLFVCAIITNIVFIISFLLIVVSSNNTVRKSGVILFVSWVILYILLGLCMGIWEYVYMGAFQLLAFSLLMLLKKDGINAWRAIFAEPDYTKYYNFKDSVKEDVVSSIQESASLNDENIEIVEVEEIPKDEEPTANSIREMGAADDVVDNAPADEVVNNGKRTDKDVEEQKYNDNHKNEQEHSSQKYDKGKISKIKKIIFIILAVILSMFAILGAIWGLVEITRHVENEKHLKFKGEAINGNVYAFKERMIKKGFKYSSQDDKRIILEGYFAGYSDCTIYLNLMQPTTDICSVSVLFPNAYNWEGLKKQYDDLFNKLSNKYGTPSKHTDFSHIEDVSVVLSKLRRQTGEGPYAIFPTDKGRIELLMWAYKPYNEQRYYCIIHYYDKINQEKKVDIINDDL